MSFANAVNAGINAGQAAFAPLAQAIDPLRVQSLAAALKGQQIANKKNDAIATLMAKFIGDMNRETATSDDPDVQGLVGGLTDLFGGISRGLFRSAKPLTDVLSATAAGGEASITAESLTQEPVDPNDPIAVSGAAVNARLDALRGFGPNRLADLQANRQSRLDYLLDGGQSRLQSLIDAPGERISALRSRVEDRLADIQALTVPRPGIDVPQKSPEQIASEEAEIASILEEYRQRVAALQAAPADRLRQLDVSREDRLSNLQSLSQTRIADLQSRVQSRLSELQRSRVRF